MHFKCVHFQSLSLWVSFILPLNVALDQGSATYGCSVPLQWLPSALKKIKNQKTSTP